MPQKNLTVLERTCRELGEDRMISDLCLSPVDGTAAFLLRRADIQENRYRVELYRQRPAMQPESLGEGPWSGVFWKTDGKLTGVQRSGAATRLVEFGEDGLKAGEETIPCAGKPLATFENGDCVLLSRAAVKAGTERALIYTNEYPLFHNDSGLIANTRAAVVYYDAAQGLPRKLTAENFSVNQCAVDRINRCIAVAGKAYEDLPPYCEEIRLYTMDGKEERRFLTQQQWSISHLAFWRGKIVFAGTDVSLGPQSGTKLMELDAHSGELRLLSDEDVCLVNTVICDFRFGAGKSLVAAKDGIYAVVTKDEHSELCRFTPQAGWQTLCCSTETVDMLDVGGGRVMFSGLDRGQRTELREYVGDGACQTCSAFHPPLDGPRPQRLTITVDGTQIRGFVLPPEHLEEGKRYPAVLSIHGGPRMTFGFSTGHDHRILSQSGAFVLWCNPTGSDGRGHEFYDLKGNWGSEMKELLAFVEAACEHYPIDDKRIGVMGGSYGGYMVNLLVAKTNRFAAAVSERSIAALPWQELLCDLPTPFRVKQFAGGIFADEERMWDCSPLYKMEAGTTPTLFLQADADYRCPLIHGAAMYQKLLWRGTAAKMIVFHKENHGLNRTAKPQTRLKRYWEIQKWFAQWLGLET